MAIATVLGGYTAAEADELIICGSVYDELALLIVRG